MPEEWGVYRALRFGKPSIRDAVRQAVSEGVDELSVLFMHPQLSRASAQSLVRELYGALGRASQLNIRTRVSWHDDAGYVNALARTIAEFASARDINPQDTYLVFLADRARITTLGPGDTYVEQSERTARLVAERVGWLPDRVSVRFGSREELRDLEILRENLKQRDSGNDEIVVCPLAVAGDDLSSEVREVAGLHVCPPLRTQDSFVTAIKNLIVRGPREITDGGARFKPLLVPRLKVGDIADELSSLVMIGASLPGRVRSRRGPYIAHSDVRQFRSVKKSRKELRGFLDWSRSQARILEAFVWNTCQRVEFYGWLADPGDLAEREYVVGQVRRELFGSEGADLKVNVLFGVDAWHHMTRTAAGLNSELPGDADIVAQLETSCRVAERIDAAGLRAKHLVDSAVRLSTRARKETAWGKFGPGYCLAALSRVCDVGGARLESYRHVIIGGSATSRSILCTLSKRFQVPQRQMTLVYRDHHGQMKLLRAALGQGKRLRVHSYSDPDVLGLIAQAEFVYFGIDYPEPVLDPTMLAGLRDFSQQPLTIVDFNSFGSMNGENAPQGIAVWTAADLDQAVAAYADSMCRNELFAQAFREAEDWIENHLPVPAKSSLAVKPAETHTRVPRDSDAPRGASS